MALDQVQFRNLRSDIRSLKIDGWKTMCFPFGAFRPRAIPVSF